MDHRTEVRILVRELALALGSSLGKHADRSAMPGAYRAPRLRTYEGAAHRIRGSPTSGPHFL